MEFLKCVGEIGSGIFFEVFGRDRFSEFLELCGRDLYCEFLKYV